MNATHYKFLQTKWLLVFPSYVSALTVNTQLPAMEIGSQRPYFMVDQA